MDIFGSELDDDLFESEKHRLVEDPHSWIPRSCEYEWFYDESVTDTQENVNIILSQANRFYYSGKYEEACKTYSKLIKLTAGNCQLGREVSEGLARTLIKTGSLKEAIQAAYEMERNCKSTFQFASFHSLCAEIHHQTGDYVKELAHLQSAITVHSFNPDLWLRLCECYCLTLSMDLSSSFRLSPSKDASWHAGAALVRSCIIMKSILMAGADTHSRKRINVLYAAIQPAYTALPPEFATRAHKALSRDVFSQDDAKQEFEDLGSSKICATVEESESESSTKEENWFENQWFRFQDTMSTL